MNERWSRIDFGIFAASLVMVGLSIVLVYSSSFAVAQHKYGGAGFFLDRQIIRAVLALACFMIFINVDYHVWGKLSGLAYALSIFLLLFVLVMPGHHAIHGAKRWISLGFIQFQASELALMVVVILFADHLQTVGDGIRDAKRFAQFLGKMGVLCALNHS